MVSVAVTQFHITSCLFVIRDLSPGFWKYKNKFLWRSCEWWPTRCNYFYLIYLFLISCTCFVLCLRPSSGVFECIYSFWYSPSVFLLTGVMDEMELQFHLMHDTSQQQYRWTISEAVEWNAPDDGRKHRPIHNYISDVRTHEIQIPLTSLVWRGRGNKEN